MTYSKNPVILQAERVAALDAAVQRLLVAHEVRATAMERMHVDGYRTEQLFETFCASDEDVVRAQHQYGQLLVNLRKNLCMTTAEQIRQETAVQTLHGQLAKSKAERTATYIENLRLRETPGEGA